MVPIRIFQDEDGVWCASGVDHVIRTQGLALGRLFAGIDEATQLRFEEELGGAAVANR